MPTNDLRKQFRSLQRNKRLLWLAILAFVIVVFWIAVSIFTSQREVSISKDLQSLATPLIPRLEAQVFSDISSKRVYQESELSSFPVYVFLQAERGGSMQKVELGAPQAEGTPTPTASEAETPGETLPSPEISATPEPATGSTTL
jgi:hypothetical protein